MKSSEQDGKGGEGRGLPAGFAWEGADDGPRHLFGTVAGERIAIATAFPNGGWRAGVSSRHNVAQPRPGESLLAAAQAAAEAALWRCDGYGTGEVRGLVLSDDWLDHIATILDLPTVLPVALPGLPGMWKLTRLTSAQPITVDAVRVDPEGGVEVDAVCAQAEPTPRRSRPMPPVAPGAGRGEGDEEDEPDPCAKHGTTGSNIGWQVWCPGCNVALHREPAPSREPIAPTALPAHYDDGERREWIAEALGVPSRLIFLGWSGELDWALNTIAIKRVDEPGEQPEGLRASEIAALAAAGIVATTKGWAFMKEQGR